MAYTYDPSQKIEQGFGKVSSNVSNAFTAVIAQHQRDYNLAENTFLNIEALKKNLNIHSQKEITDQANALLAKTSSIISKDGKLDFAGVGAIRQQISAIGSLKEGYDMSSKALMEGLQLGIANKDSLDSYENYYKESTALMSNKDLVGRPQDFQKALMNVYTNNLDYEKMFGKSYLASNPRQPLSRDVIDPKTGALNKIQSNLSTGWTADDSGKNIAPAPVIVTDPTTGVQTSLDYADQEVLKMKATNPNFFIGYRKKHGLPDDYSTEHDIMKTLIDKNTLTSGVTQIRSATQIHKDEVGLKKDTFDVEHQPQEFKAKMGQLGASTEASKANTKLINIKIDEARSENNNTLENVYDDVISPSRSGKSINVTGVPLGKNVKININGKLGIATDIYKSKDTGSVYAKVLLDEDGKFAPDDMNVKGANLDYIKIDNPSVFEKELKQRIKLGGYSEKDARVISTQVGTIFRAGHNGLKEENNTNPPFNIQPNIPLPSVNKSNNPTGNPVNPFGAGKTFNKKDF